MLYLCLTRSIIIIRTKIAAFIAAAAIACFGVFGVAALASTTPPKAAPVTLTAKKIVKKKVVKKKKHRVSYYHLNQYNLHELEVLWIAQGGNKASAHIAAAIALAESGGHPREISSTNDWGLWQINAPSHPTMYTLDPGRNTTAAIKISRNGRDWSPWVTYQTGAYWRHW